MSTNLFDTYFMLRLNLFWKNNLRNEVELNDIIKKLRKVLEPQGIENYLTQLKLSEDSKELIYLLLGESCRRAIRKQENPKTYSLNPNPSRLIEMIALKWEFSVYWELYRDIFNVLEIEDFYFSNDENICFLDDVIRYYEKTSLLIPENRRIDLKKWLSQNFRMHNKKVDRTKHHREATILTTSQKLVILHAMFENLGIKIGYNINKSDFLRFFQSISDQELTVSYKDASFRKEYDKLFTKSKVSKANDYQSIEDLLQKAGLEKIRGWIKEKYKL